MKKLKIKILWVGVIALSSIILFLVNNTQGDNSYITGFSSVLFAGSIAKLVLFIRIYNNPLLLKKYEIYQKEERLISISEKSGRFTLVVTLMAEFVAMYILISTDQSAIATVVAAVVGLQTLVYLCTYYYLCKKY